jgi:hypothetical protein
MHERLVRQQLVIVVLAEAGTTAQTNARGPCGGLRRQLRIDLDADLSSTEKVIEGLHQLRLQGLGRPSAVAIVRQQIRTQLVGQLHKITGRIEVAALAAGNQIAGASVQGNRRRRDARRTDSLQHFGSNLP